MIEAAIERLRQTAMPPLKLVDGAAAYAAIKTLPAQLPAAYVVPLSEDAGENLLSTTAVRQRVSADLGVVIVVGSLADARKGGQGVINLKPVRESVRAALLGWKADAGATPFLFTGGELLVFADGAVWWQDGYRADYYVSKT